MFQLHEQLRYANVQLCWIIDWLYVGLNSFLTSHPPTHLHVSLWKAPTTSRSKHSGVISGHDLKAAILLGKMENYINVANELHMCVVKFCVVLFLIACGIEIYSIGRGPESCKMPSVNLCDTGTLTKLENRATSICPRVLHLRRSFSILRTLGFATQAFRWISMWSANFEIRFQSPGRTAFVGFRLTLIYVRLWLTNLWEARNWQFRRGGPFTAEFWPYCSTRIVCTYIHCRRYC